MDDSGEVGGDDTISGDNISNIYADEEDEEDGAHAGLL